MTYNMYFLSQFYDLQENFLTVNEMCLSVFNQSQYVIYTWPSYTRWP